MRTKSSAWVKPRPAWARVVHADRWADGNGASLAAAQGETRCETLFMLVTADHVFGGGGLDPLLAAGAPAVLIDPAPDRPAWGGEPGAGGGRGRGCLRQAPG